MASFDKISDTWKRLAGIVAAVIALSTATVQLTGWETNKVTACYILAGLVMFFSGWMLDDHVKQFEKTNEEHEKRFDHIDNVLGEIRKQNLDIHKDTVRLQLLHLIQNQPDNIDTIMTVAEEYFCTLGSDWYMTNIFMQWCEDRKINPDIALSCKVKGSK